MGKNHYFANSHPLKSDDEPCGCSLAGKLCSPVRPFKQIKVLKAIKPEKLEAKNE